MDSSLHDCSTWEYENSEGEWLKARDVASLSYREWKEFQLKYRSSQKVANAEN